MCKSLVLVHTINLGNTTKYLKALIKKKLIHSIIYDISKTSMTFQFVIHKFLPIYLNLSQRSCGNHMAFIKNAECQCARHAVSYIIVATLQQCLAISIDAVGLLRTPCCDVHFEHAQNDRCCFS